MTIATSYRLIYRGDFCLTVWALLIPALDIFIFAIGILENSLSQGILSLSNLFAIQRTEACFISTFKISSYVGQYLDQNAIDKMISHRSYFCISWIILC